MTLVAELRHNNRVLDIKHGGTRTRLDAECRLWCSKQGKAATLKRINFGTQPPTILAEYRHDGAKLHVEIVEAA